jgi:hypothetical protein
MPRRGCGDAAIGVRELRTDELIRRTGGKAKQWQHLSCFPQRNRAAFSPAPVLLFTAQICPTSTVARNGWRSSGHEREWAIGSEAESDANLTTPSGQSLTLGPFRRFQGGEQSFADARVNGKVAPTAVTLSEFKAEAPAAADSTVCPDSMQARDGSVDVSNGSSDRRSRFGLVAHLGIQAINRSGRRSSKRHCPAS